MVFPLGALAKRRAKGLTDEIWNATLDEFRAKIAEISINSGGVLRPVDMDLDRLDEHVEAKASMYHLPIDTLRR